MTTVTAQQLIESAMGKIGMLSVGDTLEAEDAQTCLRRLNALTDSLESESFFAYTTTETTFTLPASTASATIGDLQTIDVARPVRLLPGGFSRIDGTDYPLRPVNEEQYNSISLKSTAQDTYPEVCFYDGATPTGLVYFWPVTSAAVEVHLVTPESAGQAEDLTTIYEFAQGYQRYVEHALAIEIAPDFNVQAPNWLLNVTPGLKRALKRTNLRVPQLDVCYPDANTSGTLADKINGVY